MAQRKIKVGDEWPGSVAHRWRVVEIKPFGKAEIRSVNEDGSLGFKFGEMRLSDIRRILDAQEPVAHLRDLDGTGSYHPCAASDPGAFPVFADQVSA